MIMILWSGSCSMASLCGWARTGRSDMESDYILKLGKVHDILCDFCAIHGTHLVVFPGGGREVQVNNIYIFK